MDKQASVEPESTSDLLLLGWMLLVAIIVAAVALAMSQTSNLMAAVGIGILIFQASFMSGGFLGFIFGVPRVLSRQNQATVGTNTGAADGPAATSTTDLTDGSQAASTPTKLALLSSNTNLERISDWLTTMLVGAGLVQLHAINDGLLAFRLFLADSARVFTAPGAEATAGALPAVGPILLVFGAAAGFLFMYLNTRLVLVRIFHSVEARISGEMPLGAEKQRLVRAFARDPERSSFIQRRIETKGSVSVEDALNVMFDLLYKAEPHRVIELGAQLSTTGAVDRPDYWFYLAAAFGQQMHRSERDSDEWRSARDNALDSARRAVDLDPAYRARLWNISNPASTDNDLALLRDDPEFLRMVGRL